MKNTGQEGIQTKVLKELQLLTPLRAEFIPEETDSYYLTDGNYLDGADLVQYKGAISRKIREETSEDKGTLNLMDYFYGSDSIKQKIESIEISVKQVDHKLYGCATLKLQDSLNPAELKEAEDYLLGQYSDGWREGFEQREIPVDGGELYVHFWSCREMPVMYMTEEQSEKPLKIVRPKLRLYGHDGNIFSIMADASYLLREAGRPEDARKMQERVHASGDYYTALNIISEYVKTELSIDKEKKPEKKPEKGGTCR